MHRDMQRPTALAEVLLAIAQDFPPVSSVEFEVFIRRADAERELEAGAAVLASYG